MHLLFASWYIDNNGGLWNPRAIPPLSHPQYAQDFLAVNYFNVEVPYDSNRTCFWIEPAFYAYDILYYLALSAIGKT